jgi:hypothetical protein
MTAPTLCIHRRRAEEMSERQIQALIDLGKNEAELIDQLEAAVNAGDKVKVWEIAVAITASAAEAGKV